MAWQTPKTDWSVADSPNTADVNRWETNTEEAYTLADAALYWSQLMHISGNVIENANQISIPAGFAVTVQTICVYVKPRPSEGFGTAAQIRFIGFDLAPAFRLRIQAEGESRYFQSLSESDYYDATDNGAVDSWLFVNETDSPVKKKIIVSLVNVSEDQVSLLDPAGWSFQLSGLVTFE